MNSDSSPDTIDDLKDSNFSQKPNKKNTKKKLIWVLIILIIGIGGWYGYKVVNPDIAGPRVNPLTLIPSDALYILESEKPYKLWDQITQTEVWELLEQDEEWREYGAMLSELEEDMSGFHQALDILANRTIYMSAHPYRKQKTDYLYIIDFEGLGVVSTWLRSLDNVTVRSFQEKEIYEKLDLETKETFYFTFEDNYLLGSYTHTLVEKSILEKNDAILYRSFDFIDVRKKVLGEGLARIYLNYDLIFKNLGLEGLKETQERLPFIFSGLFFDIEETSILMDGYSNFNDSLSSYLNIFTESGTGSLDIAKVAPANTSVFLSLGFDSFQKFYRELAGQLSQDKISGEDFDLYTRRTEKFLNISIEEDVVGWIDDELALIQIEADGVSETAFILKGKSADEANESMAFLSRQVKRKTPVRFKEVEYKGYKINYMAVKGLFNLIFGKLFQKYDRPYFTIIDEFVVFASNPSVLRDIIDDYGNERTLSTEDSFIKYQKEIGKEHSLMLYLQLELLAKSDGGILDNETMDFLKRKSNFLKHFPQMGMKFSPDDELFRTKMLVSVNNLELFVEPDTPRVLDSAIYEMLFVKDPGEQIVISEIEIEDFGAKNQTEADSAGNTKYDMEIKDGLRHGNFFEYHPTGELKTKGKYKNDQKDGTWKYYDPSGKFIRREKYKNGVLVN